MALSLVTAPATEPLTVAEVKAHLRIDSSNAEPAPSAPTVALAGVGAGNVDNGAHRYLVTFVTADGETDAGLVSSAVTVADKTVNGKVALSNIPLGGSLVTARNLYRTIGGGTTYLRLAQLADNTTTAYTDNIADSSLGAQAPTANTTSDPRMVTWISAARQNAERFTHRAFITQTWDDKRDGFPCWYSDRGDYRGAIVLPKPPVSSITSITYLDTTGASQTWASANYITDLPAGPTASAARIVPAYNVIYPQTYSVPNAVTVRFVCGYGAASAVPVDIKQAMELQIWDWWRGVDESTDAIARLLWPYKAF